MYSWVTLFAIIFIQRINKLFNTLSLCIHTVTYPTTHFSRLTLTNDRTVHCGWALCSRSISTLSASFRLFISNGSKCLRLDIRVLMRAEFVASAPPRGYKQNYLFVPWTNEIARFHWLHSRHTGVKVTDVICFINIKYFNCVFSFEFVLYSLIFYYLI